MANDTIIEVEDRRQPPADRRMDGHRYHDDLTGGGPFSKWFSWGHMGLTLALCSLVFNFWNNSRQIEAEGAKERLLLEARIVILESDIKHQAQNDVAISAIFDGKVAALEKRIDINRGDTVSFRDIILRHIEQSGGKK